MDDFQARLVPANLVVGEGTDYGIRFIEGPESKPSVRQNDLARTFAHGDVAGRDFYESRLIQIGFVIVKTSPADAVQASDVLVRAWSSPTAALEQRLDWKAPGRDERSYFGRYRDFETQTDTLHSSVIESEGRFLALDPYAYGPETALSNQTGTFVVNNAGDQATPRLQITITGNGGKPKLVNTTHDNRFVEFGSVIANGATVTLDFAKRTVIGGSGENRFDRFAISSQWFALQPGNNSLVLSGAASVNISWRPAYLV